MCGACRGNLGQIQPLEQVVQQQAGQLHESQVDKGNTAAVKALCEIIDRGIVTIARGAVEGIGPAIKIQCEFPNGKTIQLNYAYNLVSDADHVPIIIGQLIFRVRDAIASGFVKKIGNDNE